MPELPEVETVVRDLQQKIIGKKIRTLESNVPRLFGYSSLENVQQAIKNTTVHSVNRRGKNIFINLVAENGEKRTLGVHLKMTGHFLVGKWKYQKGVWVSMEQDERAHKVNSYVRALITFTDGVMLALCDARKFARMFIATETAPHPSLAKLGPDALDARRATANYLFESAQKRRIPVKQFLLDQTVIAGIGNIYADEILWKSKIHPKKPTASLSIAQWRILVKHMNEILLKSIAVRGASMSDYRDTSGARGGYSDLRCVYRRTGELCQRCASVIVRLVVSQRSSHICPQCQIL